MKKSYETPSVEKIAFRYRDQIVATSAGNGGTVDDNSGSGSTSNRTSLGAGAWLCGDGGIVDYVFDLWGSSTCE